MSIDWRKWDETAPAVAYVAPGLPGPSHPSEADVFARHAGIPGHDQRRLASAHVLVVGAGGLGSWAALGLARSGVGALTLVDPDRFDRTNAPRQLLYGSDLGACKAVAVARNLVPHMVGGGTITALPAAFDERLFDDGSARRFHVALFLVDNNRCRWFGSRFARRLRIPAVFAMLSPDGGVRMHHFLQGPNPSDACLWCALPNLDITQRAPCAAAVISSCLASAGVTVWLAHRALMGGHGYNWREDDLAGERGALTGFVRQSRRCPCCAISP